MPGHPSEESGHQLFALLVSPQIHLWSWKATRLQGPQMHHFAHCLCSWNSDQVEDSVFNMSHTCVFFCLLPLPLELSSTRGWIFLSPSHVVNGQNGAECRSSLSIFCCWIRCSYHLVPMGTGPWRLSYSLSLECGCSGPRLQSSENLLKDSYHLQFTWMRFPCSHDSMKEEAAERLVAMYWHVTA